MPPEEPRKRRGAGGCLAGLGVLLVALTIVVLSAFFIVKPQIDQMIADMGGTSLKQLYSLYKEVTTHVDESKLVTHPFTNNDYVAAKQKLLKAGYNIFDENGNVKPGALSSEKLNTKVKLTDKEFAALLNNVLVDFLANGNIPIYTKLKLNATFKQVKITSTLDDTAYKIVVICAVNTNGLTSQMGILGGLIPEELYLTTSATYSYVNDKLTYSASSLKLNQIKDSSFQELLNIINRTVMEEDENLLKLSELSNTVAALICDGLTSLEKFGDVNIALTHQGIDVVSKHPNEIIEDDETPKTPEENTEPQEPTESGEQTETLPEANVAKNKFNTYIY